MKNQLNDTTNLHHIKPTYLTEPEAAKFTSMSTSFLRKARCTGHLPGETTGPPFSKIGRAIRYAAKDLDAWMLERRHG